MSRLTIDHTTSDGTIAYAAFLYFDDGDFPNAEVEECGYFTEETEALAAVKATLAGKPADGSSEVLNATSSAAADNTAGWSGQVEKGKWTKDDDDEWFAAPSWERDDKYDGEVFYRGA